MLISKMILGKTNILLSNINIYYIAIDNKKI